MALMSSENSSIWDLEISLKFSRQPPKRMEKLMPLNKFKKPKFKESENKPICLSKNIAYPNWKVLFLLFQNAIMSLSFIELSKMNSISLSKWNAQKMVNFGNKPKPLVSFQSPSSNTMPRIWWKQSQSSTKITKSSTETLNHKTFYLTQTIESSWSTSEQPKTWAAQTSRAQATGSRAKNLSNITLEHQTTWLHNASTTRHHKRSRTYTRWAGCFTLWRWVRLHLLGDRSS